MIAKTNLLGLSQSQLESFFLELGEKRFRATQLMKWMHHLGVDDFSLMNNLSKKLRETLQQKAEIVEPEIVLDKQSVDGTRKWVIRVASGSCVETVYIPEANRGTLCVSSQVGCALDCSFCSTGKQGFNSNLTSSEIVAQLRLANRALGCLGEPKQQRKVTNVVLMGMGEPLLNFDSVMSAVSVMMDDFGYGISKRRVTVSTAGVVPALLKMNQFTDASIAISLHAPNDELRNQLVPINKKYPIAVLLDAVKGYLSGLSDKRKATIEYTLLKGVNDQPEHAAQLVKILKDLPCKINLIPFNPFPNSEYRKPSSVSVQAFRRRLTDAGFNAVVRTTRGDDIDAACGQLVGQVDDKTRRNQRYQQLWATSEAQTVTVLPHS